MQLPILILVIFSNCLLALFVYENNPKSATNIIFTFLSLVISSWLLILYLSLDNAYVENSLIIARLSIFLASLMNFLFFLLSATIPSKKIELPKNKLYGYAVFTAIVMIITISPFAFTVFDLGRNTIEVSWGIVPFAILSALFTYLSVYSLIKKIKKVVTYSERQQLQLVLAGIFILLFLLFFTVLLPVIFLKNFSIVPLSPVYVLIFLAMTAYAIIHSGLLDLRLIVARTVSFVFVNFLMAVIYGFAVYVFIMEAPLYLEGVLLYSSSLFVLAVALLSFEHVEKWITVLSNKVFFRKEYNPEYLLDQLTRIMASTIELDLLTQSILKKLTDEMNITKGVFVVLDNHKISDIKGVGYSVDEIKSVDFDKLFHSDLGIKQLVFEEMEESSLKKIFRNLDISFALPITVDDKDIAVLLLGQKSSGDVYFDRDIQFLNLFAREAGIAIQNSKSYNEIKLFNKELESRVEARTKDLEESQEREREKSRSVAKLKDEFFFVATHELRAPITAIRGFLELVTDSSKKIPKDLKENLGSISYASDHLNQLVNDLLEIARSEADAMKIDIGPVDMDALVDDILKELTPMAKQKKVKLRNGTFYALKALADKAKVKEVLVNLISNSIKYNREGGLVFVQVVSVPGTDKVFVEVRDTGYGIPLDQQDKIFGKFFRASSEDTNKILGTGLGLFLTRMLVQKMGGDISFSSIPGEGGGTTFSFYLNKAA